MQAFKYLPLEDFCKELKFQQQLERVQEESLFLDLIWNLMNANDRDYVYKKVVTDFLKLIFDPYMIGTYFSNQNINQKTELTLEYVIELKRLAECEALRRKGLAMSDK